jgi:hypothetical protein
VRLAHGANTTGLTLSDYDSDDWMRVQVRLLRGWQLQAVTADMQMYWSGWQEVAPTNMLVPQIHPLLDMLQHRA